MRYQKRLGFIPSISSPLADDEDEAPGKRRNSAQKPVQAISVEDEDDANHIIPLELMTRLRTFPLFANAPQAFLSAVGRSLKLIQFHPQEYVVKRGETAKSMYWILRGSVCVTSTDGESSYAELSAGSFFGEIGILFNRPRTATVVARTKVLLGVLTKDSLNSVLPDYPSIERLIRDEAQERLAMQEKRRRAGFSSAARNTTPIAEPVPVLPVPKNTHSPLRDKVDDSLSARGFLESLPLFKTLPLDQIHELALSVELIKCNTFQYVLRKGDVGRDIFFVVTGAVEVLDPANDNRSVARLGPGKYFGEMAFLSSLSEENAAKARSADIRAISQCELLVVRGDTLEDLCKRCPLVAEDMKTTARERMRNNDSVGNLIDSTDITAADRVTVDSLMAEKEEESPVFSEISWNKRFVSPEPDDEDPLARSRFSSVFSPAGSTGTSATQEEEPRAKKPRLSYSAAPVQPTQQFSLTSMDPALSMDKFQPSKVNFQYTPYAQRLRINSVQGSRRRSSILSTGPLPDSIMLKILEQLDLKSLVRCAAVNRHWKQLCYLASNLCQTLDLTPYSRDIDDSALIQITNFVGSRPQVIDISNCHHITDEGFSYMISEIGIRGSIKVLRMRDNWNISAMAIMDLGVPSVGHDLVEIDLANCRKVRVDVIERLVGSNSQSSSLQIGCPMLSKINLSYCKYLTDRTMLSLAENASDRLEELNLTRCTTITDTGFSYWTNRKFPRLRKVSLRDCTFLSDVAITSLAMAAPNLEELDLTFCCVLSDNAIAVLYLCCKNLRRLNLSFCGSAVSDSSVLSLSKLTHLETLILTGCIRVTRQGIDTLLSSSKSLRHLDLSQCPRINEFQGNAVEPFEKTPGTRSAYLKVSATDEIVEVVL